MNSQQSDTTEQADIGNEISPVHEAPELFLERGARGVTVAAVVALLILVTLDWATVPVGHRSFENFMKMLQDLAEFTTDSGWNIIALAIALVAIAITAVAIVGLLRVEDLTSDRHWLIMKTAEAFMLVALGFLAALTAASVFSALVLTWKSFSDKEYVQSIGLIVIAASAVTLWMTTRTLYGYLRRVVVSDSDRRQEDLTKISLQRKNVEELKENARVTVIKLQKSKKNKESSSPLARSIWTAVRWSAVWVVIAALLATGLALFPDVLSSDFEISKHISRIWRVFLNVSLLASLQMVFVVFPYVWSSQLWQTEESGIKKLQSSAASSCLVCPWPCFFSQPSQSVFSLQISRHHSGRGSL